MTTIVEVMGFKSRLFFGFLIFAFLFKISVVAIFLQSDKEIIYDYETVVFTCFKDPAFCTHIAKLNIAITGKQVLSNISIDIRHMPEEIKSDIKYLNLLCLEKNKKLMTITKHLKLF